MHDKTPADPQPLWIGRGEQNLPNNQVFGRLLRQYRTAAKIAAKDVAEHAGVTPAFVRGVERGVQSPSRETAERILDRLGLWDTDDDGDIIITDPDSGQRYVIRDFTAVSKGDNSRWSLQRLIEPGNPMPLVDEFARTPTGMEQAANRPDPLAGKYGIAAREDPAQVRLRVVRRVLVANTEQVARVHELLDELGVLEPWDEY